MSDPQSKQSIDTCGIEKYEGSYDQDELGVTQIPTETILQIKSFTLLAVYTFLASRPSTWKLNAKHLAAHFDCNKEKIYKALEALIAMGFITRTQIRDKGKFVRYHYRLHLRQKVQITPSTEKPDTVKPDTEKPDTYKTEKLENKEKDVVCETPTQQQSQKEKTETKALTDEKNVKLFQSKFGNRDITIQELFKACQTFNAPKNRWVDAQLFNKWLTLENPENFTKKGSHQSKPHGTGESDLVIYSRYIGGIKSDVSLGLLPSDTIIPTFEEWKQKQCTV